MWGSTILLGVSADFIDTSGDNTFMLEVRKNSQNILQTDREYSI